MTDIAIPSRLISGATDARVAPMPDGASKTKVGAGDTAIYRPGHLAHP